MKNEEKFWNDPKNIKWFSDQPAPEYWVEFFNINKTNIKRVLDLGCGAGRNTQYLFESGFNVFACDYYDGMVKATIKRLLKLGLDKKVVSQRVIKASMLELPYEDGFFDVVLSNGVFHNVSNLKELETALMEASRVLRKNGHICFNLFSSNYVDPSLKEIDNGIFLTKEGLPMALISKEEFVNMCKKYDLVPDVAIVEYEREVTTGKRSVMRGVLKKN